MIQYKINVQKSDDSKWWYFVYEYETLDLFDSVIVEKQIYESPSEFETYDAAIDHAKIWIEKFLG